MSKRCRLFGEPRSPIDRDSTDVPSLRVYILELQDEIDGLNIKISSLNEMKAKVASFETRVSALENQIPTLVQQLRGVNQEMNRLHQVNLDSQTAIRALTERLDHYLSLPRT